MQTRIYVSRRNLLATGLAVAPAVIAPAILRPTQGWAQAANCLLTPRQTEGPFYPRGFGGPPDDLFLPGQDGGLPDGEAILIVGRVTDRRCRPLPGAVVEIWQADRHGRYQHPRDRGGARDPHFRYWGRALSDGDGQYRFRTIVPGAYKVGFGWWRPPHVHFKVRKPGLDELTTQMYCPGHPLNAKDGILGRLPEDRREILIARPGPKPAAGQPTPSRFDIALA